MLSNSHPSLTCNMMVNELGQVSHMFVNSSEDSLGIVSSDGQLLRLNVTAPANLSIDKLTYMMSAFHNPKSITGLDVCVRKPVLLTSCKDNTIKVWNFQNHELELQKNFSEEIFSVSLHPNGLHCAIAFADKLRLYHILVDDLRLCLEVGTLSGLFILN
jgi:cilia- and flagella-associated protein 57